MKDLEVQTKLV